MNDSDTSVPATDLGMLADWPETPPLPVLFVGHGSPMNAVEDNAWRRQWQSLGTELLDGWQRPSLILCISAHWITQGWHLTAMERPRTIHDFGGFPQILFDQQYPAPGAPAMAEAIGPAMSQPGSGEPLGLDTSEWGLDHGAWSVLKPMFPAADIPVIQLSMDYGQPPEAHFALGQQLAALRRKGVLIVGSGNVVHNLRALNFGAGDHQAYDWAIEFDRFVADAVAQGRLGDLSGFRQLGRTAQLAHPSWDHYLPLLYAAGAVVGEEGSGSQAPVRFFNEGFQAASISMRSMLWR